MPLEMTFFELPIELQNIALCESRAKQEARGPYGEVGILQIHPKYHREKAERLGFNIFSAKGNMAYGYYLAITEGLSPWLASKKCWLPNILAYL